MSPGLLFLIAWGGWGVSWALAAWLWASPAARRRAGPAVWRYRATVTAGIILLERHVSLLLHARRLWHVGYGGAYLLVALTFVGIGFAWWARLHLGRLWSGSITAKADHRIVETGPYALVRHPIYTGLIFSTLMTALAVATWPALAGFALIALGLWMKARMEEGFLAEELGPQAYAAYRARVAMLVPFLW